MNYEYKYLKCCTKRKVDLADEFKKLQDRPAFLRHLTDTTNKANLDSKKFRPKYNSELAFGSVTCHKNFLPTNGPPVCRINGETSYNLSDLYSRDGQPPLFSQHYAIDPEASLAHRRENIIGGQLDQNWITQLDQLIRQINPLAKAYKLASKRLTEARLAN